MADAFSALNLYFIFKINKCGGEINRVTVKFNNF